MSLQTTTMRALRHSLSAAIEGISPEEMPEQRYVRVRRLSDVPGAGFRNFFIEMDDAGPVFGGIFGNGVECSASLSVFVNYQNLDAESADGVIWSDCHNLWLGLLHQRHPIIVGFLNIEYAGWQPEESDPGQVWGAHVYDVRFYARGMNQ